MQASIAEELRELLLKWGADFVGFAPVERFDRFPNENRPTFTFPETRSVIVYGIQMVDPLMDLWLHAPPTTGAGRSPSGRAFEDEILKAIGYHFVLNMYRRGFGAKLLPYGPNPETSQDGFLYLKDAAVLAGLGVIGKNNLLLTPQFGPRVRLRAIAIAKELPPSRMMIENPWCTNCDRCVTACPVNALDGGKYNREKCLTSPFHKRNLSPGAELWCTRCSCVCPVGSRVPCDDTLRIQPL
jgi:epoxyqueuosine reductase